MSPQAIQLPFRFARRCFDAVAARPAFKRSLIIAAPFVCIARSRL